MADIKAYKEAIAELQEYKKMLNRFKKGEITESEFEDFASTHDIIDLYRRIDELETKK
jgi:DNA integrity scanning protein DisA with diadenylate cyclase activity